MVAQRPAKQPVIEEPLAEELKKYKGRWVAIDRDRVVASGDSAAEVLKEALARSVTDPLVFRVPEHTHRVAFYPATL